MNKTHKALYILLGQVLTGKYSINEGKLFDQNGKELGCMRKNGYLQYCVRAEGFKSAVQAQRLMYLYYYGTIDPELTINHINGNKLDNRKENLEMITRGENTKHSIETGLQEVRGSKNGNAKLTENDVSEIKRLLATNNYSKREIGRKFGVSDTMIGYIEKGKWWRHVS